MAPPAEIRDSVGNEQLADLLLLYEGAWWARDRDRDGVERMLAGSTEVAAAIDEGDRLVGFARAVSDGAYRAMIYDVIVAEDARGADLGARLIADLMDRPSLRRVPRVDLECHESMAPYYERLGFGRATDGIIRMSSPAPGELPPDAG